MRMLSTLLFFLCAFSFVGSASAVTFDVTGFGQTNAPPAFVQSSSLTGTFTIDTVAGTVTAVNLMLPGLPETKTQILDQFQGGNAYVVDFPQTLGQIERFTFPDSGSLVGYLGGTFSLALSVGPDVFSGSGTLTPEVATTPLPAALPLFASGLAAAGLFRWRRKRKAAAAAA